MARHENTPAAMENALNAVQALFTANPLFLTPQSKQAFQAQARIFDELEKFSLAWFQRRQDATLSLIDAGRRIASEGVGDPAKTIKEVADWQTSFLRRFNQDAKDCTEMLTKCACAFSSNDAKAAGNITEIAKTGTSMPV